MRSVGDALEVEVEDNGPGIPAEEQVRIFEKFHQATEGEAGAPRGTGLGLTISQRIVEHHGGRIWCDSVPGDGATFTFRLPIAAGAEAVTSVDTSAGLVTK